MHGTYQIKIWHCETYVIEGQGQDIIPVMTTTGPLLVSAVIMYALTSDADDVIDKSNFVSVLKDTVQVSIQKSKHVKNHKSLQFWLRDGNASPKGS